jgi:SPP1 gp7 family putative phage head morphogenesis protein
MFKALSELIEVLEADIPANPKSPKHQKQVRSLQRILAEYFKDMGNAFPYSKLDGIYNKNVKEAIGKDADDVIDPVIKVLKATLLTKLRGKLVEIYFSGTVETVSWGKTKGGIPIAYEGPPMQKAIDWAEKQGAKLVTQMDEETKRRLANIISQGIENKRGVPGLSKDLRTAFGDMTKFRSEMISRTETANALSQSSLTAMEDMGIDGKEWIVNNPCDICLANEGDGPIPVTQAFTSGDMAPPAHPNCECAIAPFMLKK